MRARGWKYLARFLALTIVALAVWKLKGQWEQMRNFKGILLSADWRWIILAVGGEIGSYIADGWLNKQLLKIAGVVLSFGQTLKVAIVDVFASQTLPLGEAGAGLMSAYFFKKIGVDNGAVAFLIVAWGILTGGAMLVLLAVSWLTIPIHPDLRWHISWLPVYLVVLLGMLLIAVSPLRKKIVIWTRSINWEKIASNKLTFVGSAALGFGYYISLTVALWACMRAFDLHIGIGVVIFALCLSQIAKLVALVPGGIGVVESSLSLVFLAFGQYPAVKIVAGVLLYRAIDFWIPMGLGLFVFRSLTKNKPAYPGASPK